MIREYKMTLQDLNVFWNVRLRPLLIENRYYRTYLSFITNCQIHEVGVACRRSRRAHEGSWDISFTMICRIWVWWCTTAMLWYKIYVGVIIDQRMIWIFTTMKYTTTIVQNISSAHTHPSSSNTSSCAEWICFSNIS